MIVPAMTLAPVPGTSTRHQYSSAARIMPKRLNYPRGIGAADWDDFVPKWWTRRLCLVQNSKLFARLQ